MRIAVLVKQVPRFEAMALGPDGRLVREGLELEMNPYCRRAVAKGVELARAHGGTCTVFTLGPESAQDCLREAIAWGADDGVLVSDPAFAGSDTLATARALAGALAHEGRWDLVLAGRNSVDADTGQVPPELAELLDLPLLAGVRELRVDGDRVWVRCEHDDGWVEAAVTLPAVLSCAERLCDPAKVPPEGRAAVDPSRIRRLAADQLGPGPWGQAGSPTAVGRVEVLATRRSRIRLSGSVEDQVAEAIAILRDRGALVDGAAGTLEDLPPVPEPAGRGRAVGVVGEPDRDRTTAELLGAAAGLGAHVVLLATGASPSPDQAASWGADEVVRLDGSAAEDDVAPAVAGWCASRRPWAVLGGGTVWGREVLGRVAARLDAGLTGDAVDLDVEGDRLVGWKPAFGGALVCAVTASSPVQLATVRPGMLARRAPRPARPIPESVLAVPARGRVRVLDRGRDDDLDALATAAVVVGVGQGVHPSEYPLLQPLLDALGAEWGATRKVTDKGWLPRARQIGITGRSISPRLYVCVGASGKFNHLVGVRDAGCVLAVNPDPAAPVFDAADVGIVADWHDVVPRFVDALSADPAVTP